MPAAGCEDDLEAQTRRQHRTLLASGIASAVRRNKQFIVSALQVWHVLMIISSCPVRCLVICSLGERSWQVTSVKQTHSDVLLPQAPTDSDGSAQTGVVVGNPAWLGALTAQVCTSAD